MSLNYTLTKTPFHALDKTAQEQEWPVVSTVILMFPVLGISGITAKNLPDVVARVRLYESLFGGILTSGAKSIPVPLPILRNMVGVTSNVTAETTRSVASRLAKMFVQEKTAETVSTLA